MRILMLAQFYPPIIGGEERLVHDLSVELVAQGHDVAVATLWHEGMQEFECDQGVRIHRIRGSLQRVTALFTENTRQHMPPFPDPEVLWALRRIILQERPEVVHAHNWMLHSFTPIKAWSKAKLIVSLHDCSLVCAQKRFMMHGELCSGPGIFKCLKCSAECYGIAKGVPTVLGNWASAEIERQVVDMFLPVSQAIVEANQLDKRRVPYRIIPNFVLNNVNSHISDDDQVLSQLPQGEFLLYVGNVGREKGVEVLLKAYVEMHRQIPLVLIGELAPNFSANFPSGVLALQGWPHTAVMTAWSRCAIGVVPSICLEAFGIVALEAMSMGKPLVASCIGGLPDIIVDGKTGFLVTPGNAATLQMAIERLLDDSNLREQMGAMAKQRLAEFEARAVIPRVEQVYQEVLYS